MKRFGFGHRDKLRLARHFEQVFARGTRAGGATLTVRAAANGLDRARLGISVGRSSGGAAQRNRFKRLVREAFRLNRQSLPFGWDLVVAARGAVPARLTLKAVQEELIVLARRACGVAASSGNPS